MKLPNDAVGGGLKCGDLLASRYKVRSLAGSGGMSQVYVAEDLKLNGKQWAIKEVRHMYAAETFLREAKIMSQLHHPCLPNIIDYFAPNEHGFAYLVMDYIAGETVEQWFRDKQMEVSVTDVLNIALQLCSCFHYLHELLEKPIVYRDVKPANVMRDELGQIRLIDFGIARLHLSDKSADTLPLGTLHFAAPEQLEGGQSDQRTDLYGIGALLYYLLSGGKYFNVERKTLTHWRPDAPKELIHTVDQLLEYEPEKRVQSAADLEQRLRATQQTFERKEQRDNGSISPHLKRNNQKLIVVGGLYAGAGATFTALQLARLLNQANVLHNVTELTYNIPQHYYWLGGEQACPKNYVYYNERMELRGKFLEWTSGRTVWNPLRPVEAALDKTRFNVTTWLRQVSEPVTIVDVSADWEQPLIRQLCEQADLICFVADPQKAKFNGVAASKNVRLAIELQESRGNVHFVANRSIHQRKMKSWFEAFPWPPAAIIPNVAFSMILEAERSGKLVQDTPALLNACQKSFVRLVEYIK